MVGFRPSGGIGLDAIQISNQVPSGACFIGIGKLQAHETAPAPGESDGTERRIDEAKVRHGHFLSVPRIN
jgi:hypothetical protein